MILHRKVVNISFKFYLVLTLSIIVDPSSAGQKLKDVNGIIC